VAQRRILPNAFHSPQHSNQFIRSTFLFGFLFSMLAASPAQDAKSQAEMQRWVSAKFLGQPIAAPPEPYLLPRLDRKGKMVLRNSIQGHTLLIANRSFDRGLAMRYTGEIGVVLPAAARSFQAVVGEDSNDVGYYSNTARGNVVASVIAAGIEAFRSPIMHEGMPGIEINASLHGAHEFTLRLTSQGERTPVYQNDWDQADWGNARVIMEDGSVLWLDKLRMGAPESTYTTDAPFSFVYNGKNSANLLKQWNVERSTRRLDAHRTRYTVTYTDPSTQLVVRCVGVAYNDFPSIEWTVYFKNNGSVRTPILENIQAMDTHFAGEPDAVPVVHHSEGSSAQSTDFRPFETPLPPAAKQQFASRGGRPTDGDMPYFNVAWRDRGLIAVLGWPGQWSLQMEGDAANGVRIAGGQQQTHFWLAPGEEVRTPLAVLQFWTGDWLDGQNAWRRWMVEHNLPRNDGKLPPPQLASGSSRATVEMQWANEANQKEAFLHILDMGLPINYWWMDAGWYPLTDGWWKTGTWEPDTSRFPHGLRAISDVVHQHGHKVIVWFEPERVTQGSWLEKNHPEWLIGPKGKDQLLFLGNPEAWHWLVAHVSQMIQSEGIDTYRQDFNFEPLKLWQSNDTPDRAGITEIEHVEGYLAYFDELHRRFPHLLIDTCASGGRRDDLETLRRAVPLWRSDFAYEPDAMQMQTYGLAPWVPYFGTAANSPDPYVFRSQMTPAMGIGLDGVKTREQHAVQLKLLAQWKQVAEFYYGDFYPLTPYSAEKSAWMAWQYALPDRSAGMVQVFRRTDSPFETARLPLRGLNPKAHYVVTNPDTGIKSAFTGADLIGKGVPVSISAKPGAVLLIYKKATP
jgi:alpha-galactosidase